MVTQEQRDETDRKYKQLIEDEESGKTTPVYPIDPPLPDDDGTVVVFLP